MKFKKKFIDVVGVISCIIYISQFSCQQLFKQDATSFYTQKIAENMGFITVFELRYKAYRGEDGEPIFKTSEPHKFLKVMVKVLE